MTTQNIKRKFDNRYSIWLICYREFYAISYIFNEKRYV